MTVTEVGCMVVKPDLDIMNDSTPEGQILTGTWNTVLSKPGGPQRVYWGLESKDPSRLWAFFDFESIEQHQQFAQEHGVDAVRDIPKICTHGEFTKHVKLDPSSEVLGYATAEAMLVYFQDDITEDKQQALSLQVKKIFELTFAHFPGVKGVAHGWGVEKDFPTRNEDGQPRAVLMAVVGWENAEVQRNHFDEDSHQEAVSMIAGLEGCTSFDSFTISCRHLKRS
ncbi:hypothetical protein BKA59DRAFT_524892 [Fusarium tricinctum]|uniref:ABM domain-containing protein n=1 Tax=Fusarium tricinctum TaxID=61284 RepID=A0A8K0S0V0_9HYPO|nr:hypothetical protein BKA59DRAFT_524892 [Fusarium tricinctum]